MQSENVIHLHLSDLRARVAQAVNSILEYPGHFHGRGIVTGGGGFRNFTNAWVLIRMLRYHGCNLPIELWHFGETELDPHMRQLLAPYHVEFVDVYKVAEERQVVPPIPNRLKSFAVLHSNFEGVLWLDSDNIPICNPEYLFEARQLTFAGALFWPQSCQAFLQTPLWMVMDVPRRVETEFDTGQAIFLKEHCWEALHLARWLETDPELSRFYHGSNPSFRFAWHKFGLPVLMPQTRPQVLEVRGPDGKTGSGILCQSDLDGQQIFQHRRSLRWHLFATTPPIAGSLFEPQCRGFIGELRKGWNGRIGVAPEVASKLAGEVLEELLQTVWITEKLGTENRFPSSRPAVPTFSPPAPPQESGAPNPPLTPSAETVWGHPWHELRFFEDGTLGGWSDRFLTFWDVIPGPRAQIKIHSPESESFVRLVLQRVNRHRWDGVFHFNGQERLVSMEPAPGHAAPGRRRRWAPSIVAPRLLKRRHGGQLAIVNSAAGIGDHIAAIYAATAAANTGLEVTFHTGHHAWLNRVQHPGLKIVPTIPANLEAAIQSGEVVDVNRNYLQQIRYGSSRARWYASNLAPDLEPQRPVSICQEQKIPRFDFRKYVLVAPCSAWKVRDWPSGHWQRLIYLLKTSGYEVVGIGTKRDEEVLATICDVSSAFWVVDHPPEWITDAMLGAAAVVANDSGMAHLGGLLGVPTIAVHAQLPPELLWQCTEVHSVTPTAQCTFCRWCPDRGYHSVCETGCTALAAVPPEQVLRLVQQVARNIA